MKCQTRRSALPAICFYADVWKGRELPEEHHTTKLTLKKMFKFLKASVIIFTQSILTLLDAKACSPLLQSDVIVAVSVTLLEETGGAMLHGNEGSAQGGELCVGQVSGGVQNNEDRLVQQARRCWEVANFCSISLTSLFFYESIPLVSTCYVPVTGVLIELTELPVDGEDVHVVVLLEVMSQQVQRVITGLQPLLVLEDLLHLKHANANPCNRTKMTACLRISDRNLRLGWPLHFVAYQRFSACVFDASGSDVL